MTYTALPDRRIPYDNDGSVMGYRANCYAGSIQACFDMGLAGYVPGAQAAEFQDDDYTDPGAYIQATDVGVRGMGWWFFPEQRVVSGLAWGMTAANATFPIPSYYLIDALQGSNNSGNGVDGTWETATLGLSNGGGTQPSLDGWRKTITSVSFTGGKRQLRGSWRDVAGGSSPALTVCLVHLYGEKTAGQTPDDIIFIDHDTTPGVEYTAPEDFEDQMLGTTVVRQFRIKNTSATKTANTIALQCNDTDFAISTDSVNWVVTINLASLAASTESPTYYVRCTTPAPGGALGPRFNRIVCTVGSWT
jgi:hypothetical protein